jgi:hypothetical protein
MPDIPNLRISPDEQPGRCTWPPGCSDAPRASGAVERHHEAVLDRRRWIIAAAYLRDQEVA